MITNIYPRGTVVEFVTTPRNAAGSVVSPSSVALRVRYSSRAGSVVVAEISMTQEANGTWTAEWDSDPAGRGLVEWDVQATSPDAADQGQFQIKVNRATP